MMSSVVSSGITLQEHLQKAAVPDALQEVLLSIAGAGYEVHRALRLPQGGMADTHNVFGERQSKLDMVADDIFSAALRSCGAVHAYASEEQQGVLQTQAAGTHCVVFDPLDGSSLIGTDFSTGSIAGIYAAPTPLERTPREQVAAVYLLYGPCTVLTYSAGDGVHTFALNDAATFVLQQEYRTIAAQATTFSPGSIAVVAEQEGYARLLRRWIERGMTLRYSGCMVADLHHLFVKGQGIFVHIGGRTHPQGKLRLAYECGPFAWLLDQAGGCAHTGTQSLLDVSIDQVERRTPFIAGSREAVEEAVALLSV